MKFSPEIMCLCKKNDKMLAVPPISPEQKESYYKMRFIHSLHDIEERVFIALKSCGYIDCKLVALNNLDQIKDLDLKTNDVAVRRAVEKEFGFEIPIIKC
ncbi:hypothetical protein CEXT_528341 [Caerostris extrusa]|uniref:Uncharacterized protein n=1 Tax=Caerostris extrusa TaxID=172846 RepID=A0AAV4SXC9_CAEEX|nr:hypothetical protein CEXT_528341 [Caerostris extrusa]